MLEPLVAIAIVAFLAPKLSALVLLFMHWAARRFYPWRCAGLALAVDLLVFFAAILIPVDFYIRPLHGPIEGNRHAGPRLVRTVVGMPMTQRCIEKYGEFVSLGCAPMPFAPTWVFVWK